MDVIANDSPQPDPRLPAERGRPDRSDRTDEFNWLDAGDKPDVAAATDGVDPDGRLRRWRRDFSRTALAAALVAAGVVLIVNDHRGGPSPGQLTLDRPVADDAPTSSHATPTVNAGLTAAALAAVPIVPGTRLRNAAAMRDAAGSTTVRLTLAPGDYLADLVCVGRGTITVVITNDDAPRGSLVVPCAAPPASPQAQPSATDTTGISADGGAVRLVATPVTGTAAALAWRIRRP